MDGYGGMTGGARLVIEWSDGGVTPTCRHTLATVEALYGRRLSGTVRELRPTDPIAADYWSRWGCRECEPPNATTDATPSYDVPPHPHTEGVGR
jgi:hypothetical protein